jgi:hypothetical protein
MAGAVATKVPSQEVELAPKPRTPSPSPQPLECGVGFGPRLPFRPSPALNILIEIAPVA